MDVILELDHFPFLESVNLLFLWKCSLLIFVVSFSDQVLFPRTKINDLKNINHI